MVPNNSGLVAPILHRRFLRVVRVLTSKLDPYCHSIAAVQMKIEREAGGILAVQYHVATSMRLQLQGSEATATAAAAAAEV